MLKFNYEKYVFNNFTKELIKAGYFTSGPGTHYETLINAYDYFMIDPNGADCYKQLPPETAADRLEGNEKLLRKAFNYYKERGAYTSQTADPVKNNNIIINYLTDVLTAKLRKDPYYSPVSFKVTKMFILDFASSFIKGWKNEIFSDREDIEMYIHNSYGFTDYVTRWDGSTVYYENAENAHALTIEFLLSRDENKNIIIIDFYIY